MAAHKKPAVQMSMEQLSSMVEAGDPKADELASKYENEFLRYRTGLL